MADDDWWCVPRLRRGHPKMAALRRSELHSRLDSTAMLGDDDDVFDSVTWETPPAPSLDAPTSSGPGFRQSTVDSEDRGPHDPKWEGYLVTSVHDPVKELAETKDAYVSYLVSAKVRPRPIKLSVQQATISQTNLPIFSTPTPSSRRRFQDFVFLRENLVKDFPACVVPALPDKHRLGSHWPPVLGAAE